MFAVFGLGNPGTKYLMNRHNVGYMVIDKMVQEFKTPMKKLECQTIVGHLNRISGEDFLICKPLSYMNDSGTSVRGIKAKYNLDLEKIIVIQDDLDLPLGEVRLKQGGGAGGHNGIRSVTKCLGDPNYLRIKIGIDHPGDSSQVIDYVLNDFNRREQVCIQKSLETALFACLDCIDYGFLKAANKYNQKQN